MIKDTISCECRFPDQESSQSEVRKGALSECESIASAKIPQEEGDRGQGLSLSVLYLHVSIGYVCGIF